MRKKLQLILIIPVSLAANSLLHAQSILDTDLTDLFNKNKLTVFNRQISVEKSGGKNAIVLGLEEGEGLVWVNDLVFSTGTIEIDLKGQDLYQHSFLGIAFHAENDSVFDAIYFRPFQFLSTDLVRKSHGVQYISLPVYTWQKLRAEYNGVYENEVIPPPDPNDWFHVKIVIDEKSVVVFVNDNADPVLRSNLLNDRKKGKIALYTADQSGGSFANLKVESRL